MEEWQASLLREETDGDRLTGFASPTVSPLPHRQKDCSSTSVSSKAEDHPEVFATRWWVLLVWSTFAFFQTFLWNFYGPISSNLQVRFQIAMLLPYTLVACHSDYTIHRRCRPSTAGTMTQ